MSEFDGYKQYRLPFPDELLRLIGADNIPVNEIQSISMPDSKIVAFNTLFNPSNPGLIIRAYTTGA